MVQQLIYLFIMIGKVYLYSNSLAGLFSDLSIRDRSLFMVRGDPEEKVGGGAPKIF